MRPDLTHRPLLSFLLLAALACEPSSIPEEKTPAGWQGTMVEEGATLTVRTTSGSVWGGEGRLIEVAAIGTETRGENDLLGRVMGIDATADRIFVADGIFVMVRVYDMAGDHVMNIGRHGGGPGEFYSVTDLGIDPMREQLVIREGSGALHRLTLSGEYVGTLRPHLSGGLWGTELLLHTTALFTIDSTGAVTDSLDMPMHEEDEFSLRAQAGEGTYKTLPIPFGPRDVWSITWDGAIIWGNSSEYRFEIRYPDGRQTVFERDTDPVRVRPDELEAAERRVYGIMQGVQPGWAWNGPGIPDTKPFYSAIIPDRSGRLWILREGEGRPVEGWTVPHDWKEWERNPGWAPDRWFEVFEEESGRYLGRVVAPEGFVSEPEPVIEGNSFICLTEDEFGRPIVRRYRLDLPA